MQAGSLALGISIHALLAESDYAEELAPTLNAISIHALLAESDAPVAAVRALRGYFYPRSPCGERRALRSKRPAEKDFYPRSPCGERLAARCCRARGDRDFYPRSPCGERPLPYHHRAAMTAISIHALLAESDCAACKGKFVLHGISIHALLAESDQINFLEVTHHDHFYPRSPCGERPRPVFGELV